MKEFLLLLAMLGCDSRVRIVIDPMLPTPAYYRDGTMYLRSDATKQVIAHECAHSRQKQATTQREWELNEYEARMAELRAREE